MKLLVTQSCSTLYPPGFSVHGILQAGIPKWVAIPFSRGIFPTQGSRDIHIAGRFFIVWASKEAHVNSKPQNK